jgi:hypothetical protein
VPKWTTIKMKSWSITPKVMMMNLRKYFHLKSKSSQNKSANPVMSRWATCYKFAVVEITFWNLREMVTSFHMELANSLLQVTVVLKKF